jgi:uncharacterized protein YkwD
LTLLLAAFAIACKPAAEAPRRPAGALDLDAARRYVVELVNHDRALQDLPPVELDETASAAGQEHAADMVTHGYTAHWGSDGSVPEDRYTRADGTHFVQENAACFFDGQGREIERDAHYPPALLEAIEAAFIGEKPPHDGHRLNILKLRHNRLGVGIVKPVGVDQPCLAQEFIDDYGDYSALPRRAKIGQSIHVSGTVEAPAEFLGVGISRIEPAHPLNAKQLNETSTYRQPEPHVLYFPKGYKTPKPVSVSGRSFEIDVPLSEHGRVGRYGVSIWAKFPETGDEAVPISQRTIEVR